MRINAFKWVEFGVGLTKHEKAGNLNEILKQWFGVCVRFRCHHKAIMDFQGKLAEEYVRNSGNVG